MATPGNGPAAISDQELHALVDGQLSPERAAEVGRLVADDPDAAARTAAYRQQNEMLRRALDPMLDEPVPERLRSFASPARPEAANAPAWRAWAIAASLVVAVGAGALAGWTGRGRQIERDGIPITFSGEAATMYAVYSREQRHPVEVWAAEEQHLVQWLSKRLGEPLKAPRLAEFGFSLVGGRLVAGQRQPTAMFMYQNGEGQRITITARRSVSEPVETGFRYVVENGVGVFYWVDSECGYAISGEIDRSQLLAIGRSVYGQLASKASKD